MKKRNHSSVNSFSRSVPAYGLKMLYLSRRSTDVPVAVTNDKNSLHLRQLAVFSAYEILSNELITH